MSVHASAFPQEEHDACEAASRELQERGSHFLGNMFSPVDQADPMFDLWFSARSGASQLLSSIPTENEVLRAQLPGDRDTRQILIRAEYKAAWDAPVKCLVDSKMNPGTYESPQPRRLSCPMHKL
jgi:hypothetical protein